MVWVRSEYAGELAVLSAWLSALLPWSVSVASLDESVTLVVIRFPLFRLQYILGLSLGELERVFLPVTGAPALAPSGVQRLAAELWLAGAAVVVLAVGLAVAMYLADGYTDYDVDSPDRVDPVRLMGVLLLAAGVLLGASSWLLQFGTWPLEHSDSFPGFLLPVGVLVQLLLAGALLTVDRVGSPDPSDPQDGSGAR